MQNDNVHSINPSHSSHPQKYRVLYTTKPAEALYFWQAQETPSDVHSATLTGLKANQTYSISVSAASEVGTGPFSYPIQVLMQKGGQWHFSCFVWYIIPIETQLPPCLSAQFSRPLNRLVRWYQRHLPCPPSQHLIHLCTFLSYYHASSP